MLVCRVNVIEVCNEDYQSENHYKISWRVHKENLHLEKEMSIIKCLYL